MTFFSQMDLLYKLIYSKIVFFYRRSRSWSLLKFEVCLVFLWTLFEVNFEFCNLRTLDFVWSHLDLMQFAWCRLNFELKNSNLWYFTSDAQPDIFQGSEGFVKLGHSDKHFFRNLTKKEPAGENFEFSSLRYC